MAKKSSNNLVGTAGEYYVCAELCRRGYLALLTPKNNPLFDVVATNVDGTIAISIQVKTRSIHNKQGWKLSAHEDPADTPGVPFIVLVNLHEDKIPDFYVFKYTDFVSRVNEIFQAYISKPKRTGEARKVPDFRWFNEADFIDADRAHLNNWAPLIQALDANDENRRR